ncbi:tRNA_m1G_MT domain-containing protein [Cephalotus follicularis]|uniref:tRNA (guanine(9)-N(1))-methyltransferase n=1 Tax=Cephalotus follicularis TaxID=3775 RepID=A0A1Q3BAL1_CEPFO|nr:tRNA_m1G_MT domain-containing protein [Cephalotus follicularis]
MFVCVRIYLAFPKAKELIKLQIMYCYVVNGRCNSPAHVWLTGCNGEMGTQLERLPGFDKWIIEKESQSYIEALQHHKENLIYLTADSKIVLYELHLKKIYIVGGLVDRNRWKGITMRKVEEQGIQTAKLPIGSYLIHQLIYETRDWKISFFEVIPSRKRCEVDSEEHQGEVDGKENKERDERTERKKTYIKVPTNG